jgi:predicted enzyme related to lactoylglutathione lyase
MIMKAIEIAFVCYAVTNLKKARDFYENSLNLKPSSVFEKEGRGFVEYEMGPHTLAIGCGSENFKPGPNGGTVALEVEDFEEAIQSLKAKNVRFLMDTFEGPVCRMAKIADPDGNNIVIHKRKPR